MQDGDRKLGDRGRGDPSMRDDDRRATQRAQRRVHDEQAQQLGGPVDVFPVRGRNRKARGRACARAIG